MVIQYAMVYYLQLCNMQCVHVHLVLIFESQQGTQHAPNVIHVTAHEILMAVYQVRPEHDKYNYNLHLLDRFIQPVYKSNILTGWK